MSNLLDVSSAVVLKLLTRFNKHVHAKLESTWMKMQCLNFFSSANDILEMCPWESYCGQTGLLKFGIMFFHVYIHFGNTFPMYVSIFCNCSSAVRGMMYYRKALILQSYLERMHSEDISTSFLVGHINYIF
jgi:hypothetical protein